MSLRPPAFVLLVLTVLLAVAGDWAYAADALPFWRLPAALLLLGLAYEALAIARTRLLLRWNVPARWPLGREKSVSMALANAGPHRILLQVAPQAPVGIDFDQAVRTLAIAGGGEARIALSAVPRRLGRLVWPEVRGRLAGPLGLAWWPRVYRDAPAFSVVPDLFDSPEQAAGRNTSGVRASARTGAGAQVLHLRAFQLGDPLRVVDWKATARRGQLISRDFSQDQHLDIVLAIDVGRGSGIWCGRLDRLGHYVNLSARFAQHAVDQDDRVGVVAFGDRALAAIPPGRGVGAVTRIRKLLGALRVQATDSNPIHATARIRTLVRHRSLVILLTDLEDAASGSQLVSAVRLLQPQHLPFVLGVESRGISAAARAPARQWLDPYFALAAQEHLRRRERNIRALAARGVSALVSGPERLEAALFDAYARFRRDRRV